MAIVAKWLTHRIVAPTLVGSIPIGRPIFVFRTVHMNGFLNSGIISLLFIGKISVLKNNAGIAQLAEQLTRNQ